MQDLIYLVPISTMFIVGYFIGLSQGKKIKASSESRKLRHNEKASKTCTYNGNGDVNPCIKADFECNSCKYWKVV